MEREIIGKNEEELRNPHTEKLILVFVERLIHGVSFFSNSKSVNMKNLRILATLFAKGGWFLALKLQRLFAVSFIVQF